MGTDQSSDFDVENRGFRGRKRQKESLSPDRIDNGFLSNVVCNVTLKMEIFLEWAFSFFVS